MKQTPVNEIHNDEVLKLIPSGAKRIIEFGCSSGANAREFKKLHLDSDWIGIEIDSEYAELAKRYCDKTIIANVENFDFEFYSQNSDRECWIFADVLEHLRDPWSVIKNIRKVIPNDGAVVACIPNAQNWTFIGHLSAGSFRYLDEGLFDRTHLRWFTRKTIFELFEDNGFIVSDLIARSFHNPPNEMLDFIGRIAQLFDCNPEIAKQDSIPFQYIVKALPV